MPLVDAWASDCSGSHLSRKAAIGLFNFGQLQVFSAFPECIFIHFPMNSDQYRTAEPPVL